MAAGPRPSLALSFVAYTALRLVFFVVPLLIIWALGGNLLVAALFAAVIGFALSMILLDRQRRRFAGGLQERAASRRRITDETAEDGIADDSGDQNASAAPNPRP
jgi:ABC-type bacteriocin/lantibiotic exporter with double-glycine peptidase domain